MTRKNYVGVALLIILLLIVGFFALPSPKAPNEQFRLGIILPLSGDLASLGENGKNGAELAYSLLATSTQNKLILEYEDDQFKPQNTVSAFNKLVASDKVDAVVCLASGPCNAIAPIAEEEKVPLIGIASDPNLQRNKKFVVRLEISPATEATKLLEYIQQKNYQRIASIVAEQDGIKAGYANLEIDNLYSSRETAKEFVQPDARDFRTIITKLLAQKPKVIFIGLLPGFAGDFGRQAREQGYTGDFIGFNFIEGDETLSAAKGSLDGMVYTNAQTPEPWFITKYESTYKKSTGPGSTHLFDVVTLIGKQVESGKTSNLDIINYLTTLKNYNGALGVFSSTDDHQFTIPVMLKTIKNGRFEKL